MSDADRLKSKFDMFTKTGRELFNKHDEKRSEKRKAARKAKKRNR